MSIKGICRFSSGLLAITVALPLLAQADLVVGKRIFESQCGLCHGQDGRGGLAKDAVAGVSPGLLHAVDAAA